MEITWRVISREEEWGDGGKVQGIRSIIGRYKIDGKVKNSTGNEEIKEFICKTHGHELRGVGNAGGRGREGEKVQRISSTNDR